MAEAILQHVIENLAGAIGREIRLICGAAQELERLSSTLSVILSVLEDAEVKQLSDRSIKNWLLKLRDAAYAIDDILDECQTDALLTDSKKRRSGIVSKVHTTLHHMNSVMHRRRIGSRMSAIRSRIDEIAEERRKFHLREVSSVNGRSKHVDRGQSSSKLSSAEVYGRDEDTKKIVQTITKEFSDRVELSVAAVVGMGGIGKTTVVQTAFSDPRVSIHFDPRVWVSVPEDFDPRRILKTIVESASGNACEDLDLDFLERRIQELLSGKRFLLVLDDVWNEEEDKWEKLRSVLDIGSPGSSVVITTRVLKVSMVMSKVRAHTLAPLSDEQCWALFMNRAFGEEDEAPRALVSIGRDIVRKCGGIPMAAKALGSLMRFKVEENEWIAIRDSELWELAIAGSSSASIFPSLRVSFSNLPVQLRSCFAYCAVFPRSAVIKKDALINLWMANGLIPSEGRLEPEDVGNRVCNELCWGSFFHGVVKDRFGNTMSFRIHDLMHDLAQSIMEDECRILNHAVYPSVTSSTRHATAISGDVGAMIASLGTTTESLRTFLQYRLGKLDFPKKFFSAVCSDYTAFRNLRVLDSSGSNVTRLPNEISNLKHLRYFDLSSTGVRKLPESMCALVNLQTLMLENCWALEELPQQLSSLRQLRHLQIRDCPLLADMPANLGRLIHLQTLSNFIVGKNKGRRLDELQYMNLRGELYMERLDNVSDPDDAKKSNLSSKHNLRFLELSWQFSNEHGVPKNVENTIEALHPHSNLSQLCLRSYRGDRFPNWIESSVLHNLVSVELYHCIKCVQLPLLGTLPCLQLLRLEGMNLVKYIESGKGTDQRFPSLRNLHLSGMRGLLNLSKNEEKHEERHHHFPQLVELSIAACPNLALPWLPSLKDLKVFGCSDSFLSSISCLVGLASLTISVDDRAVAFHETTFRNLTSLQSLKIDSFSKLETITEIELQGLDSLQSLVISSCSKLKSLSDFTKDFAPSRTAILPTLQSLAISRCLELDCLPYWLGNLMSLQSLTISYCPRLKTLPKSIEALDQLQTIRVWGCPNLERRCAHGIGEDWNKIAHVPKVQLIGSSHPHKWTP